MVTKVTTITSPVPRGMAVEWELRALGRSKNPSLLKMGRDKGMRRVESRIPPRNTMDSLGISKIMGVLVILPRSELPFSFLELAAPPGQATSFSFASVQWMLAS
jgi:hypothetical protein